SCTSGPRVRPGSSAVDVAAGSGLSSLRAVHPAPGAGGLAFEPAAPVFRALRRNAEIHGGIRPFQLALGKERGQAEITYYPHLTLMSSLHADAVAEREVLRAFLAGSAASGGAAPEGRLLEELLDDRLANEPARVPVAPPSDGLR